MLRKSRVDDNEYQTPRSLVARLAAEISDAAGIVAHRTQISGNAPRNTREYAGSISTCHLEATRYRGINYTLSR
jgi:hypothetical protein